MRPFVSTTVAAIIALHTVLGCCWHHWHEDIATSIRLEKTVAHPGKAHSCDCHTRNARNTSRPVQHDDGQGIGKASPSPKTCEGKCDTTALNRTQQDEVAIVSYSASIDTLGQPSLMPAVLERRGLGADEAAPAPPIRLHLLHKLLLI